MFRGIGNEPKSLLLSQKRWQGVREGGRYNDYLFTYALIIFSGHHHDHSLCVCLAQQRDDFTTNSSDSNDNEMRRRERAFVCCELLLQSCMNNPMVH